MENLTLAQSWLLEALPASAPELLYESRQAARMNVCVGLPRTMEELIRMMEDFRRMGWCESHGGGWIRTNPKPKKEGRLFE